jgi:uncharacterized protein (TIGR02001 family)
MKTQNNQLRLPRLIKSPLMRAFAILLILLGGGGFILSTATARAATQDSSQQKELRTEPPTLTEDSAEQPRQSSSKNNSKTTSGSTLKISATVDLASNYIYRGITQTHGRPTIQASLDLNHESGFGVGGFTSNIDLDDNPGAASSSEADAYLVYNQTVQAWKYGAMFISSNYVNAPEYNAFEYSAYVGWDFLKLDFAYAPKYFQNSSSSIYARLSANLHLGENDSLILALGRSAFENEQNIGFKSYFDSRLGVAHSIEKFAVELDFTATNRRHLDNQPFSDQALSVTIARTFE